MGRGSPWSHRRSGRGATVVPTLDVYREVSRGKHRQLKMSQREQGSAVVHTSVKPAIPASVGKYSGLPLHSF